MGEVSEPFEVKTGVRQGDGLSPLLFNCVLEKVMREWRKRMEEEGIPKIKIGRKKDNLEIDCLAFADDLAILAENAEDARRQINGLKEIAEMAGLQISYEKTEYMTNRKDAQRHITTKYGKIKRVNKFKYLGELILPNALDKEAILARARKMELAFQLTKNIYNKKSISINAKLRHYNTVVKPEGLYASECLALNTARQIDEVVKKERKIIRKILGPEYEDGKWKRKSNREIYARIEKITDTMRRRRMTFYGHIKRMDEGRLTKRIFNFFDKNPKTQMTWIKEVRKDMEEMKIGEEDVGERKAFREKIRGFKGFQEKAKKKTGAKWTEERRKLHGERMREYWAERRKREK